MLRFIFKMDHLNQLKISKNNNKYQLSLIKIELSQGLLLLYYSFEFLLFQNFLVLLEF